MFACLFTQMNYLNVNIYIFKLILLTMMGDNVKTIIILYSVGG